MMDNIKLKKLYTGDLKKPEAIVNAQNDEAKQEIQEEQIYTPKVSLFFSFDIVNSTMYKALTGNWPIIIRGLLEDIRARVFKMPELSSCVLWRVIGDEMIFVLTVYSKQEIGSAVDAIFEVTQRTSRSLKTGKFFETLEGQSIQKSEIEILMMQNPLSIKAAAWIAIVNNKLDSPYECIKFNYSASSQNQIITEYLGRDIDAGFRLKSYTQDRRLIVSFELAYLLMDLEKTGELFIIDYVRLKGVWNETLYPIIWFHSSKIAAAVNQDQSKEKSQFDFNNSFRYDETDNNEMINKYFQRWRRKKIGEHFDHEDNGSYSLADEMYEIDTALRKILIDKNLEKKILYMMEILSRDILKSTVGAYACPLEIHCAVVCCDVEERKVMITHRAKEHSTNPEKWEFGCAKLSSDNRLVNTITEYYKNMFGLEIELILDEERQERQPIPIAVYELTSHGSIKKGIIFVAKVNKPLKNETFRAEKSHDRIEWIGEEEIDKFKDNAVTDFEQTLRTVFRNFDLYFTNN